MAVSGADFFEYASLVIEECECGNSGCGPYCKYFYCKNRKKYLDRLQTERSPRKVTEVCLVRMFKDAKKLVNNASEKKKVWLEVESICDSIWTLLKNLKEKQDNFLCLKFDESDGKCFYKIFKGSDLRKEALKSSFRVVCCEVEVEKIGDAEKAAKEALQSYDEKKLSKYERDMVEKIIDEFLESCPKLQVSCQMGDDSSSDDSDSDSGQQQRSSHDSEEPPEDLCCVYLVQKEGQFYKVVKARQGSSFIRQFTVVSHFHVGNENVNEAETAAKKELEKYYPLDSKKEWFIAEEYRRDELKSQFNDAMLQFQTKQKLQI